MSGHSKWHSIKHKKGIADAKRGKIFTKHAKLIAIAARGGDDSEMNPNLRSAIENAKADNVPNANIDKAIKKGSGQDKGATALEEIMYEGYGPSGTAILIEAITDNKNRSLTNIKTTMSRNGGNLGAAGSVAWMFNRKGVIMAKAPSLSVEEAELLAIDAGAEDLTLENGQFEIVTHDNLLMDVRDNLEKSGFVIEKAEISYLPKNPVKIDNAENAQKVLKLLDALEDDDDVSKLHSNFDISEDVLKDLA